MRHTPRIIVLALVLSVTAGCAGTSTRVLTPANNLTRVDQVALKIVKIQSSNLSRSSIELNQRLKAFAGRILRSQLDAKGTKVARDAPAEIECKLDIFNPDAKASVLGGGGHVGITISLKDASGTRYATRSEAPLGGWLGGDVETQAHDAIRKAIVEFVAAL